jgi:uncharacterized protein (TIGR02145 family)
MMKKLVGDIVSVAMEVLMWITFIGCALGGFYFGFNAAGDKYGVLGAFGGLLLGVIVGMFFNVLYWLVSTFQEIRNYSKKWLGKYKTEPNSLATATIAMPDFKHTLVLPDFRNVLVGNGKKIIISLLSLILLAGIIGIVKNFALDAKEEEAAYKESIKSLDFKTAKMPDGNVWMAENLNIEKGNSVCYDNNPANCQKCGRLYDWETAMKACPNGWHLPTDAEWTALGNAVGSSSTAGTMLKSKSGWDSGGNGIDKHGFSALPCGRYYNGKFLHYGLLAQFWSATETSDSHALGIGLDTRNANMDTGNLNKSLYLRSVRCLQN